ncbi:hypothetical protein HS041_28490 [Planomonospora sp. ID67723]|uniref:RHS repeat-associated core domain-containing protein n=1 Tax=Planomonospora sp. ID67723 TaxID=2738134 RepID=UPI0018C43F68|nr:RHS repeat-associated core domain-containing protein [Planomonospora sp. ID67723]MBG0831673.1 hypothetical protein [Planomonospora sp. ID67723]
MTTTTEIDNAYNLPVAAIDAAGARTDLTYDALGRLNKVWLPNRSKASGQSASTEYSYSIQANTIVAVGSRTLGQDGAYTPWSYSLLDGLLRPRQSQAPGPNGGRLLTDTLYNSLGKTDRSYAPYYATGAPEPSLFKVTEGVESQVAYTYDGLGRVTVERLLTGNGTGEEKWRTTTRYGGDRTHIDPPAGATPTTTITDARGQVIEARQYKGDAPTGAYDVITYDYTPFGQLSKVTDGASNAWSYSYDQRGRKIQEADSDKGTTSYTYDNLDRRITSTDARGTTIHTTYDGLGRTTHTRQGSATGTLLTQFVYDTVRKGQLTSATRYVAGQAYTSTVNIYDNLNRAVRSTVTIPTAETGLAGSYQFNTAYNLDGTVQSTSYPAAGGLAAEVVTYGYDELARPTTTGSNLATYVTRTQYGLTGKTEQYEVGTTAGKKAWFTYLYEYGTQRLATSRVDREGQAGIDRSAGYTYDPAGNITSIADTSRSGTDNQCFTYDYLRRLTEAWTEGDTTCSTAPAGDAVGGVQPYWHSYTYDTTGNRTSEIQHGIASTADTTRTYTYPAPGQGQHRLTGVQQSGATGERTDTFTYDATGNTTTRTLGATTQTLTWNAEGRLEKVSDGSKTTSYLYDATGSRLIRRDGTTVTLYLPNGLELKKATVVSATRYYNHAGQAIAMRTSTGGVSFLAPDHQGTGQLSINANTQNVSLRRTLPFGGLRGSSGLWPGERGFVGGTNDSTGLTHLGAREYDPATGRFISVDPIMDLADPQQIHGYTYANNNPVTFSDPTGLLLDGGAQCGIYSACNSGDPWQEGYGPDSGSSEGGGSGADAGSVTGPVNSGSGSRSTGTTAPSPSPAPAPSTNAPVPAAPVEPIPVASPTPSPSSGTNPAIYPILCRISPESCNTTIQDAAHALFGGLGFVPLVGTPADVLDGVTNLSEGNYAEAALSAIGIIPFFGDLITGKKILNNATTNAARAGLRRDLAVAESANTALESLRSTGQLPSNYVTKNQAKSAGWESGKALGNYVPNGRIGGDAFNDPASVGLPVAAGRTWREADIGLTSSRSRAEQPGARLLYSDDGLAYITTDHYKTFYQLPDWK